MDVLAVPQFWFIFFDGRRRAKRAMRTLLFTWTCTIVHTMQPPATHLRDPAVLAQTARRAAVEPEITVHAATRAAHCHSSLQIAVSSAALSALFNSPTSSSLRLRSEARAAVRRAISSRRSAVGILGLLSGTSTDGGRP